ncbi:MAG: hypothetical protein PHT19_03910 [Methylococcus sp.]|nr:hypothetical protein [Methylococcus sp.]
MVFRPVNVFNLLAKRLGSTDIALHHPRLVAELPLLREQCEMEARERHFRHFDTHEIALDDIYAALREAAGIDDDMSGQIMDAELLLEAAVVYPNPGMKALYEYALSKEKQVVLCSDMYLSAVQIKGLLEKAGISPPFELFVSGELKKSKHEGSMFELVREHFGIASDKIVHFGDNEHSDFVSPSTKGIQAHHFDLVQKHTEPRLRFPLSAAYAEPAVTGLIQGAIKNILLVDNEAHDFWFDIGAQVFGPLILGKFIWLANHLRYHPADKVLFFARDAALMHALYERYAGDFGVDIPGEYVYFSRATLLVPSFTELNLERLWHVFSGRANRTVKTHLSRLDINPHLVRREILEAGFSSENDLAPAGDLKMFDLLCRIYPLILQAASRRRDAVTGYVRQVAGDSSRIAMVDIGWVGNMQGSFSRLLQLSRTDVELTGYYYGTLESVSANYLPRNNFHSYLISESRPPNRAESLLNGGVELMEFFHTAQHGTTLGYENINGTIRPILENNPEDIEFQRLAARVQQGAMRFVQTVMPVVLSVGAENLVSTAWAEPFFRLVDNPSPEEAELLGDLTHSDAATDTRNRLPLAEKLDAGIARRKGAEYQAAYQQAYWKSAFKIRNR